jgi:RHS repeat-associated protein
MYDEKGQVVWEANWDIYGKVRTFAGRSLSDCPFRYQVQYEDSETGLYYNRFRYYSPEEGMYLSQDPIGLAGNNPTLYGYVKDTNSWIDVWGLEGAQLYNITAHGKQPTPRSPYQSHHIIQDKWAKAQGFDNYSSREAPSIMLDATPCSNQHAIITARQNARRDARIAAGEGKWSTSLKQELKNTEADLITAGVPEKDVQRAVQEAKNYFGCP